MSAQFYAIPDDVQRALALFLPLSTLLSLAKCSRHLQSALQRQLLLRFDGLFSLRHCKSVSVISPRGYSSYPISDATLQYAIQDLLGKADVTHSCYQFIEASRGYDGPSGYRTVYGSGRFDVDEVVKHILYLPSVGDSDLYRFLGWLHWQYNQLQAVEAST
jgi:hypothetical protein